MFDARGKNVANISVSRVGKLMSHSPNRLRPSSTEVNLR